VIRFADETSAASVGPSAHFPLNLHRLAPDREHHETLAFCVRFDLQPFAVAMDFVVEVLW
jgi:hypothetical protein